MWPSRKPPKAIVPPSLGLLPSCTPSLIPPAMPPPGWSHAKLCSFRMRRVAKNLHSAPGTEAEPAALIEVAGIEGKRAAAMEAAIAPGIELAGKQKSTRTVQHSAPARKKDGTSRDLRQSSSHLGTCGMASGEVGEDGPRPTHTGVSSDPWSTREGTDPAPTPSLPLSPSPNHPAILCPGPACPTTDCSRPGCPAPGARPDSSPKEPSVYRRP